MTILSLLKNFSKKSNKSQTKNPGIASDVFILKDVQDILLYKTKGKINTHKRRIVYGV